MAEIGYHPAAPSDGFGNVTTMIPLDDEIERYAESFLREEDDGSYRAGCTDGRTVKSAIWTLEALRLINGGQFWSDRSEGATLVPRLLRLAADEYERAVREEFE